MVKVLKKSIEEEKEKDLATQKVLDEMKKKSEEDQAVHQAKQVGLPYADLNIFPIDENDIRIIPEEDAKKHLIAIFNKSGKKIRIGMVDPKNDAAKKYIENFKNDQDYFIEIYVISLSSANRVWEKYKKISFLENLDLLRISLNGEDLEKFEENFSELLQLKNKLTKTSTTDIIDIIMSGAIKMKASDVHFEPQEAEVRLRYRIDGVLQDIGNFPHKNYQSIISRVKMMGGMKLNIRDIAQDGHFPIDIDNGKIDIRVNIIPGNYGESIVMRILNQASILLSIEDLGMRGLSFEQLKKEISKPNGMILTTGPTGSGKTTTLYAIINKLNKSDTKIITIEDPVEYELKGISQTQVVKKKYTFAEGLRAIVRQDPDIIMVGEIRDEETAGIAVNAALTGHLVLSTLHTNNAPASIPRLVEMGVKSSLIPSSVNIFIAQRLLRKLCPYCKEKYKPAKETFDSIKKMLSIISPKSKVEASVNADFLYRPKGCPKCHQIGYQGRIGIFEVLTISKNVEKLIYEGASENAITQAALEDGMITMTQDGILKSLEGIVSMEEVWRVTGQTDFLEQLYENLMDQSLSRSIPISEEDLILVSKNKNSFEKISSLLQKTAPEKLVEVIFSSALILQAGDIHIEPKKDAVSIRFRIDGILQEIGNVPLSTYPTLLGRIKLLSGLKTGTRVGVADSRFSISLEKPFENISQESTDVRVSIITGGFGETVVMRLLNKSAVSLDIENLGIRKENLQKIIHEVSKPNGFFINTGPTGSGKTTTLYSILSKLNKSAVKIITVEDPIEYQLEGILQTQTNKEENYDFPTALKSLMRQNPDIIMVGEIRDNDTANIALQASLTGHLVLSTLHTNDSAGTITRLLNMNIRPDDLATASNAFMAQRLVRKLCDCKEESAPTEKEKKEIENIINSISEKSGINKTDYSAMKIYKPKGCAKCNNIGYSGRTTVSEVLVIDRDIQDLINKNALSSEIKEKAIENGMITMLQDGILTALEGKTSLEEVWRTIGEDDGK